MRHIKIPIWSEFFEMLSSQKVPICDYMDSDGQGESILDANDIKNLIKDLFRPQPNLDEPICHWSEIMRCSDGPGGYGDPDYSYVILNWGQNPKNHSTLIVVFHYDEVNSVCSLFKDERFFFFGEALVVSCQKNLFSMIDSGRSIPSDVVINYSYNDCIRFQNLITGKFEMIYAELSEPHGVHVVDCEYEFTYNFSKPYIECSTLSDDSDYDDFLTSDKTLVVEWKNCNKIE